MTQDPNEFNSSNPYFEGTPLMITSDGSLMLFQNGFKWIPQTSDRIHLVKLGDTCERLARQYYSKYKKNSHEYYWLIERANEDKILNTFHLDHLVGEQVLIPDILLLDFVRDQQQES